jgi:hypothetical protein
MKRLVVGGLLLWAVTLAVSGVVVAGAVAPDAVHSAGEDASATVVDGVVTLTGFGGDVWVQVRNESISTRATAGETEVGLEDLRTGDASGSLASPALGDSVRPLSAGLCAVGLSDEDTPAQFEVTPADDRAEVAFGVYEGPDRERSGAADVVRSCAR